MEKPRRNFERDELTLPEAQQVAGWLVGYLYGDGEPAGIVPAMTAARLETLFGEGQSARLLGRFKALFTELEPDYQAVAGLYVAGYSEAAIGALAETPVDDVLSVIRQRTARQEQPKSTPRAVRSPATYIPLKTVTDQLREPRAVDEVALKELCQTINELAPPVFTERLRQLPQYLPAPTKDTWLRVITEWLDGCTISELADSHSLTEQAIAGQLTRVGKIFLKQRTTERARQTFTSGDLAWQTHALCAQTGGEHFFPEKGESAREAKKVCAACEVRPECEGYAERTGHAFGVLAGKSKRAVTRKKPARES